MEAQNLQVFEGFGGQKSNKKGVFDLVG